MPYWDDPRGPRRDFERDRERDRWRREDPRGGRERQSSERRAFGQDQGRWEDRYPGRDPGRAAGRDWGRDPGHEGGRGMEPWRRERYDARFDQDRSYGRCEDAGESAYERRRAMREDAARLGDTRTSNYGEPYAYGGQEYGLEGDPGVGDEAAGRADGWGFEDAERRRNFDWEDPGVGQSQAGYGTQARSPHDHDFDPDYLRWREEQMRAHDRDYQDWRREQHRQYDDQYRQFRDERQRHFGEAFLAWRSQRSAVGGLTDTGVGSVGQGQGGYGDKTGIPGGYNAASAVEKPSGALDPPGHLSADPAMRQVGGTARAPTTGGGSTGDGSSEFGKEPSQVQDAAGGVRGREDRSHRH